MRKISHLIMLVMMGVLTIICGDNSSGAANNVEIHTMKVKLDKENITDVLNTMPIFVGPGHKYKELYSFLVIFDNEDISKKETMEFKVEDFHGFAFIGPKDKKGEGEVYCKVIGEKGGKIYLCDYGELIVNRFPAEVYKYVFDTKDKAFYILVRFPGISDSKVGRICAEGISFGQVPDEYSHKVKLKYSQKYGGCVVKFGTILEID